MLATVLSVVQPEGEVVLGASPPARRLRHGGTHGSPDEPLVHTLGCPGWSLASRPNESAFGLGAPSGSGLAGSQLRALVRLAAGFATRGAHGGSGWDQRFRAHRAQLLPGARAERGAEFEIVAANDLGDAKTMAHLLEYDSVLGPLDERVEAGDGRITSATTASSSSPSATRPSCRGPTSASRS